MAEVFDTRNTCHGSCRGCTDACAVCRTKSAAGKVYIQLMVAIPTAHDTAVAPVVALLLLLSLLLLLQLLHATC